MHKLKHYIILFFVLSFYLNASAQQIFGTNALVIYKEQGFHSNELAVIKRVKSYKGNDLSIKISLANGKTYDIYREQGYIIIPSTSDANFSSFEALSLISKAIKIYPHLAPEIQKSRDEWMIRAKNDEALNQERIARVAKEDKELQERRRLQEIENSKIKAKIKNDEENAAKKQAEENDRKAKMLAAERAQVEKEKASLISQLKLITSQAIKRESDEISVLEDQINSLLKLKTAATFGKKTDNTEIKSDPCELSGQLFITKKDGSSVKLSGVQFSVLDATDVESQLKEYNDKYLPLVKHAKEISVKADGILQPSLSKSKADLKDKIDAYINNCRSFDVYLAIALNFKITSFRTDADGNFSVEVPKGKKIILCGEAERLISANNMERYFWFIKTILNEPRSNILVTNDAIVSKSISSLLE